jgi:hypothetical protein
LRISNEEPHDFALSQRDLDERPHCANTGHSPAMQRDVSAKVSPMAATLTYVDAKQGSEGLGIRLFPKF